MQEKEAFLRHIRNHEGDWTAWRVFADWLDEHGEAGTATDIRAACGFRIDADTAHAEMEARHEALFAQYDTLEKLIEAGRPPFQKSNYGWVFDVMMVVAPHGTLERIPVTPQNCRSPLIDELMEQTGITAVHLSCVEQTGQANMILAQPWMKKVDSVEIVYPTNAAYSYPVVLPLITSEHAARWKSYSQIDMTGVDPDSTNDFLKLLQRSNMRGLKHAKLKSGPVTSLPQGELEMQEDFAYLFQRNMRFWLEDGHPPRGLSCLLTNLETFNGAALPEPCVALQHRVGEQDWQARLAEARLR